MTTTTIEIPRIDLARLIQSYNKDHFFSVKFIKRTTNEERQMNCRKNVSAFVKGVGLAYDPIEKGLCGVWDAGVPEGGASAYRMIALEGLIEAKIDGIHYVAI